MTSIYTLENFRQLLSSSKEEISALSFSSEDVLERPEDLRVRRTNIDKGIALGKSEKYSTYIILKSGNQLYKLKTAITGIIGGDVFTKVGLKIPINCIYSVDFI